MHAGEMRGEEVSGRPEMRGQTKPAPEEASIKEHPGTCQDPWKDKLMQRSGIARKGLLKKNKTKENLIKFNIYQIKKLNKIYCFIDRRQFRTQGKNAVFRLLFGFPL